MTDDACATSSALTNLMLNMAAFGDKKVLISDAIDACCPDRLKEAGFNVDLRPGISKDDLLACIKVLII